MQVLNCFPILASFISGRCKHLFRTPSILAIGLISLFLCLARIKINVLRRKLVCNMSYDFFTFLTIWKQLEVISSELDSFEGSTKVHETAESCYSDYWRQHLTFGYAQQFNDLFLRQNERRLLIDNKWKVGERGGAKNHMFKLDLALRVSHFPGSSNFQKHKDELWGFILKVLFQAKILR